ncbi:MAG: LD-carboxypeptidase [Vampirovibrionales bacterium]|nr:LD-carboxypeptidase [Vampirovibrionales bacterium]
MTQFDPHGDETTPPSRLFPAALRRGDCVAVISPAAPTPVASDGSGDAFDRGVALLQTRGFQPKLMPNARSQRYYLAGDDAQRLDDLHAAFADPEVRAILCARGGYGCTRLLSQIDYDLIRANPRILIGFSDVTALHLANYQRTGLIGFYGPMLTSNLIDEDPFNEDALWPLVMGEAPTPYPVPSQAAYHPISGGVAEGPLTGGNLSLLAALCGTPFQPQTRGHLLFIEDWRESYYSLDRQFQQLRMAGLFADIRGLILCDFSEMDDPLQATYPLERFFADVLGDFGVPAGFGLSVGHGALTATLPIGVRARFDADAGRLTLLESPVK